MLDPTNQFNHFAFVSSGKLGFPDDSNYAANVDYDDHNDGNSDNNGNSVRYNGENVDCIVIMITIAATVMIINNDKHNNGNNNSHNDDGQTLIAYIALHLFVDSF